MLDHSRGQENIAEVSAFCGSRGYDNLTPKNANLMHLLRINWKKHDVFIDVCYCFKVLNYQNKTNVDLQNRVF